MRWPEGIDEEAADTSAEGGQFLIGRSFGRSLAIGRLIGRSLVIGRLVDRSIGWSLFGGLVGRWSLVG